MHGYNLNEKSMLDSGKKKTGHILVFPKIFQIYTILQHDFISCISTTLTLFQTLCSLGILYVI